MQRCLICNLLFSDVRVCFQGLDYWHFISIQRNTLFNHENNFTLLVCRLQIFSRKLKNIINLFSSAAKQFRLTNSVKNTIYIPAQTYIYSEEGHTNIQAGYCVSLLWIFVGSRYVKSFPYLGGEINARKFFRQ